MVVTEAHVGPTRLEIPIIDETIEPDERPQTRGSDQTSLGQADPHYKKRGLLATLPRSIGLVTATVIVTLLCAVIMLRSRVQQGEQTGIKNERYEGIPLKEQPTAQVVPETPGGEVSRPEDKEAIATVTPQSGGQGAQPEPSASAPSADEDLLKKLPLPPASERLKEEVALVQPVQSGPSDFKDTFDTAPPVEKKEIDTARKETSRATSAASMVMQTRTSPGSSSAEGGFTLNVASFKEKEKAERYKDELRRQRIEAFDWAINIPRQGTWYRVSVGNFSTREHAELFARKLEQRLKIKGIVSQAP
jgi:cell division septation protein DedD